MHSWSPSRSSWLRLTSLGLAMTAVPGLAQKQSEASPCHSDAMLVLDASGSMAGPGFGESAVTRMEKARQALGIVLPAVTPVRNVGLIVYGPGSRSPCENIVLKAEPGPNSAGHLMDLIQPVQPYGQTPLTDAVRDAAEAMSYRTKPSTIVLVTDGEETCGGNPCESGRMLERTGHDTTIHVIGYMAGQATVAGNQQPARCLAEQTGGLYVTAQTAEELAAALQRTLGCDQLSQASPPRTLADASMSCERGQR